MQEGQNARQQIVERIRQSTSILVALSNNPTVDALAASFALSLMLTKMNKHSTAVFSGVIPPAIEFLEPNKTFENNVDALRDFIISLDKEKADRLRYKVEDDVVRIFITPYKTSISEKDLQFSQGDFNVDLIVALGVEKREDLDKAIIAHGRILHDATIITVNPNTQRSSLGSIDWNDGSSSSLCEMLVTLSEAFQQPGILDAQISTALLTGIVAATERFSNTQTSPRVMTMAAQLMAAGANQQLIATNLAKAQAAPVAAPPTAGTLAKQPAATQPTPMQEEPPKRKEPGELDITHDKKQQSNQAPAPAPQPQKQPEKPAPAPAAQAPAPQKSAEEELAAALPNAGPSHSFIALKDELQNAGQKEEGPEADHKAPGSASVNGDEEELAKQPEHEEEYLSSHGSWKGKRLEPPTLGGTLNATTEEAMEDSQKAQEEDRNKTLLTHPEDKQQQQPKRKNKKEKRVVEPPAEAKPAEKPAPAPEPVPQPKVEPAPEPAIAVAPVTPPDLPPLPPLPAFTPATPASAPEPMPAPAPVAPLQPKQPAAPAPAPQPIAEPAPASQPAPAPAPVAEPNLDTLAASAAEAAAAAQPAAAAAGDIDTARQAVSNALEASPFDPAHHPLQSAGAQEVPPMPSMPVSEPLSQDALQALPPAPAPAAAPSAPAPAPAANDLPPLPPMPPMPPSSDALPPAPNLPGLNQPLPPMAPDASSQPQNPPTPPAPADPAQFKIPGA